MRGIAGEVGAGEADALARELAERLHAGSGKPDAPGLAVHRLRLREGAAGKHRDVGALWRGRAPTGSGWREARPPARRRPAPGRPRSRRRRSSARCPSTTEAWSGRSPCRCGSRRRRRCIRRRPSARACRANRRRRAAGRRPFRPPPSRPVPPHRTRPGPPGAPEARSLRIDRAVAEGRRQQIVEMAALGGDRGLGFFDQVFEQRLLVQRIDQLQRRDPVLRLDQTPDLAFEPDRLRRERGGCPGRR